MGNSPPPETETETETEVEIETEVETTAEESGTTYSLDIHIAIVDMIMKFPQPEQLVHFNALVNCTSVGQLLSTMAHISTLMPIDS